MSIVKVNYKIIIYVVLISLSIVAGISFKNDIKLTPNLSEYDQLRAKDLAGEVFSCSQISSAQSNLKNTLDIHQYENEKGYRFKRCREYIDFEFAGKCLSFLRMKSSFPKNQHPEEELYDLIRCRDVVNEASLLISSNSRYKSLFSKEGTLEIKRKKISISEIVTISDVQNENPLLEYGELYKVEVPVLSAIHIGDGASTHTIYFTEQKMAREFHSTLCGLSNLDC